MFKVILIAKNGRFEAFTYKDGRKAREFADKIVSNAQLGWKPYERMYVQAYEATVKKWITIKSYKWEDGKK